MNATLDELVRNVVESADDTGCEDDLTVASKSAIAALANYLQPRNAHRIVVIVSGGVIQDVRDIPADCLVEVHDYDCDDDDTTLDRDENGDAYECIPWPHRAG